MKLIYMINYLKVGKASDLSGRDRKLYRVFEIIPGVLSWGTLLILLSLSYFQPIWVAYFIIAFDVYWLLLVVYLGIHLLSAYNKLKQNTQINWREKCESLAVFCREYQVAAGNAGTDANLSAEIKKAGLEDKCLALQGMAWDEITHLIILPTYGESADVIRPTFQAIVDDSYPTDKMIVVLAIEEREGQKALDKTKMIESEFGHKFKKFLVTLHPDNIAGELKGKGANQAWAANEVKEKVIDSEHYAYDKILVSVFDVDTIIRPGYFFCLTYKFLTVNNPYNASYQPVPVYHNNIWQAPFFARVAATSNTFWQMMQQIRQEKLATYSSHSMTWRSLAEIGFWSTNMVSEDSRIFWHSFLFYKGNYRVEPLNFPVSMDATMDRTLTQTAKNLYKQQRRWGWGVENLPYLLFNSAKNWKEIPKGKIVNKIFVQFYGFHSWATNALIIGVIGWMPMVLGGDKFNATVLSANLPYLTRVLMTLAMVGMVLSAVISTLLLPKRPSQYGFGKTVKMILQWVFVPITIVIFGAVPGLDSQTRLMLGKYMGFLVTPKAR